MERKARIQQRLQFNSGWIKSEEVRKRDGKLTARTAQKEGVSILKMKLKLTGASQISKGPVSAIILK